MLAVLKSFIKSCKKNLRMSANNSGFSMMEVIMAMALMGITALGVMQLQKATSDTQVRAESTMGIWQIKNSVKQYFLNGETCMATLGQAPFGPAITGINAGIDETEANKIVFNNITNRAGVVMLTSNAVDNNGDDVDDNKFNGGRIKLTEMAIWKAVESGDVAAAATSLKLRHTLTLRFKFLRKKSDMEDDANAREEFYYVDVDAMVGIGNRANDPITGDPLDPEDRVFNEQIHRCFNAEGNAVETAIRSTCEAMDMDNDGIKDNIFDEATQKCVPDPNAVNVNSCRYGGTFTLSSNYVNPVTGATNCPTGYQAVITGHLTRPMSTRCGKSTCYNFYQQQVVTCIRCNTGGPIVVNGMNASTLKQGYQSIDGAPATVPVYTNTFYGISLCDPTVYLDSCPANQNEVMGGPNNMCIVSCSAQASAADIPTCPSPVRCPATANAIPAGCPSTCVDIASGAVVPPLP